jgi:hypothetical protein
MTLCPCVMSGTSYNILFFSPQRCIPDRCVPTLWGLTLCWDRSGRRPGILDAVHASGHVWFVAGCFKRVANRLKKCLGMPRSGTLCHENLFVCHVVTCAAVSPLHSTTEPWHFGIFGGLGGGGGDGWYWKREPRNVSSIIGPAYQCKPSGLWTVVYTAYCIVYSV